MDFIRYGLWIDTAMHFLVYFVMFIIFHSILFQCIPSHSFRFYSIPFYFIPFHHILFLFSSILDHVIFFFLFILVTKISAMLFDSFLFSNHFANCEYNSLGEACSLAYRTSSLDKQNIPVLLFKMKSVFFTVGKVFFCVFLIFFINNSCLENYQVMVEPWSCE